MSGLALASPASALPELLSPTEAKELGVSETDVLTARGDGLFKGNRIGASWSNTGSALDEFLKP